MCFPAERLTGSPKMCDFGPVEWASRPGVIQYSALDMNSGFRDARARHGVMLCVMWVTTNPGWLVALAVYPVALINAQQNCDTFCVCVSCGTGVQMGDRLSAESHVGGLWVGGWVVRGWRENRARCCAVCSGCGGVVTTNLHARHTWAYHYKRINKHT